MFVSPFQDPIKKNSTVRSIIIIYCYKYAYYIQFNNERSGTHTQFIYTWICVIYKNNVLSTHRQGEKGTPWEEFSPSYISHCASSAYLCACMRDSLICDYYIGEGSLHIYHSSYMNIHALTNPVCSCVWARKIAQQLKDLKIYMYTIYIQTYIYVYMNHEAYRGVRCFLSEPHTQSQLPLFSFSPMS